MDTSTVDLLALINADTPLKRVASHRGGEYHGPCPFCGGKDRFRVQPSYKGGRFKCRHCGKGGDAINYIELRDSISFIEACERLGLRPGGEPTLRIAPKPQAPQPLVSDESEWASTDPEWQAAADAFVMQCIDTIDSAEGAQARAYLYRRGLTEAVVNAHELGYNAISHHEQWGSVRVWLPRGIVIPWQISHAYWKVNIRQDNPRNPEQRYIQAAGGANGLYNADLVRPGSIALLTEGEIDALSIYAGAIDSIIHHHIVPVATGSNTGARLMRWIVRISLADRVLLAFDDDAAGEAAASWWAQVLGNKAIRLKPLRHDVNESLQLGDDLDSWIRGVL